MRWISIIALILFAAACQTTQAMMQSWIGSHEYELVEAWGVPNKSYTTSDGKKYIEYISEYSYIVDDKEVTEKCRRVFLIEGGIVMSGSYDC